MSNSPEADPIPDEPPAHLKGDKVVVTSPLSITEACFCIPAVRALRNARPDATIAVLTPDSIAPLWQTVGGLNEIIEYPEEASAKAILQILNGCAAKPLPNMVMQDVTAIYSPSPMASLLERHVSVTTTWGSSRSSASKLTSPRVSKLHPFRRAPIQSALASCRDQCWARPIGGASIAFASLAPPSAPTTRSS